MSIDHNENSYQRALYDLCALLFAILQSDALPPAFNDAVTRSSEHQNQVTLPSVASFLLGVSISLTLGGSVTFIIGFMLMPWILCLVILLYFVGFVWSLSGLAKAIFLSAGSRCNKSFIPAVGTPKPQPDNKNNKKNKPRYEPITTSQNPTFESAPNVNMDYHPDEYFGNVAEDLMAPGTIPDSQSNFNVEDATKEKLLLEEKRKKEANEKYQAGIVFESPKLPQEKFDSGKQQEIITSTFQKKGLALREELKDFIISKGASRERLVEHSEVEWLCDGIILEQKYSIIKRGEQMIDQLKGELLKVSSITGNLVEIEAKLRENTQVLSKVRFNPSSSSPPELPPVSISSAISIFDLRQFLKCIGIPDDFVMKTTLEAKFRSVVLPELVEMQKAGTMSERVKNEMKIMVLKTLAKR